MKAILTLIFVVIFGLTALGQNMKKNDTVESFKMDIVLDTWVNNDNYRKEIKDSVEVKSVARLYKFKNSRIKKALSFSTKRNKPKMA